MNHFMTNMDQSNLYYEEIVLKTGLNVRGSDNQMHEIESYGAKTFHKLRKLNNYGLTDADVLVIILCIRLNGTFREFEPANVLNERIIVYRLGVYRQRKFGGEDKSNGPWNEIVFHRRQ